jgi:tungstate transport system permease protein
VKLLWDELKAAVPLVFHGNPYMGSVILFTIEVALLATAIACCIGLPLALIIGLGRFRGRAILQWIANACIALPPVLVGLLLFMLLIPQGPLGGWRLDATRTSVIIAQTILAIPYVVAFGAAAIQSLPPGLLDQARALGAGRRQLAQLALAEARIGVIAAIIAAMATTLSEVGALVVVGSNNWGYDQTLARAALFEANAAAFADAVAFGLVLIVVLLLLLGSLAILQQRAGRPLLQFRFRPTA